MVITRIHIVSMMMLAVMGVIILSLSLMAANNLSTDGAHTFSGWRIYFSKDILPDHMAYPLLRLRDRIQLETASPEEQVALKMRFAEHRYKVAERLLDKNQDTLAVSTLSKSQKYLISGGYQLLDEPQLRPEQALEMRAALDHSLYRLERFSNEYNDSNGVVLTQLRDESSILLQKLDEELNNVSKE